MVVLWSTSLAAKLTDIGNNLSDILYSAVWIQQNWKWKQTKWKIRRWLFYICQVITLSFTQVHRWFQEGAQSSVITEKVPAACRRQLHLKFWTQSPIGFDDQNIVLERIKSWHRCVILNKSK
jgi:hypothetical protein